MNISFTGHRDYDIERFERALRTALLELAGGQPTTCYSGVAVGFDLAAAEAVLALRGEGYAFRLCCVVPFADQAKLFSAKDADRYCAVLRAADRVVTISDSYSVDVYHKRNDYLIEVADAIIAFYDGESSGGTAYTIKRAIKKRAVVVRNICPQRQLSLF